MPPTSESEVTCEPERLPIIFGVTGHRDPRPEDLEALRRTVAKIFHDYRTDYPNTPFVLLSPLAEGADRLVAEVALEQPDVRLIAALPFEQPEYERDFEQPESLTEFRRLLGRAGRIFEMSLAEGCTAQNIQTPDSECRKEQYAAVGKFLARHSHILIALWDGTDNRKTGGTAWVKAEREGSQKEASDRFQKADPLGYGPFLHVITPRLSNDTVPERACELAHPLPRRVKGEEEPPPYQLVYGQMDEFNADVLDNQGGVESCAEREKAAAYLYPEAKSAALHASLQSMRSLYATADGLAGLWQARTGRSLRRVILGVLVAALAFELVSHVIHPVPVWSDNEMLPRFLLILFLAASGFACWVRSRSGQQKQHDKYLNYRALAEALRVQFFWRLAGVDDSAGRNYEGRQWRELDWMRTAVHAQWVLSGADLPYRKRGAAGAIDGGIAQAKEHWVMDQLSFFKRRAESEEERLHRHERGFEVGVVAGFLSGVAALLLLFFWHHALLMAILFFLTAVSFFGAGLIHFRAYKLALAAHARQYKESAQVFGEANHRLELALCGDPAAVEGKNARPGLESDCLKVLRQLGCEALMENGDWVLTHRERPLEVPLG